MRIGIDARLWSETGVGRYIRNLVLELGKIDKKNEYVLFVTHRDYEQVKLEIGNWKLEIAPTAAHWHSVREQTDFPQLLNNYNLDLMHFPYFSVPVLYNRPYVLTIHDLILEHHPTGKASTLPLPVYMAKQLAYRAVIRIAAQKAKKIIVPLEAVKKDVIKTLGISEGKIEVTQEGFDTKISNFKFKISNLKMPERYFLYVGNAYPHKNLGRLIEAFGLLVQEVKYSDVSLVLVGKEDAFYKSIKKEVPKDITDKVYFLHDITDSELGGLYKNAISLVHPSLMEGFGLPPLEAMSVGSLVTASDIPSLREVCADVPIYFDPRRVYDIKGKLQMTLELSRKEKTERITKGKKQASDFSWEKMAKKTLGIYESCISLRQSE